MATYIFQDLEKREHPISCVGESFMETKSQGMLGKIVSWGKEEQSQEAYSIHHSFNLL